MLVYAPASAATSVLAPRATSVGECAVTIALRHEFNRLDKNEDGRLTRAELLMDAPRGMQQRGGGELAGEGLCLGGGRRDDAGAQFSVDARSHGSRRG